MSDKEFEELRAEAAKYGIIVEKKTGCDMLDAFEEMCGRLERGESTIEVEYSPGLEEKLRRKK